MRDRGQVFFAWHDQSLVSRSLTEVLADGTTLDVIFRIARSGSGQMFIGIYSSVGEVMHEEAYFTEDGATMTESLTSGKERALKLVHHDLPALARSRQSSK